MELFYQSAAGLARLLRQKQASAREIAQAALARIAKVEPQVQAFLTVCEEQALAAADKTDADIAAGRPLSPLAGIPFAVKDNICTKGVRTTCASRMLQNFVSPYDATAVQKLQDAGAVMIGKTNLDEFAMGSSCENSAFQITRNPWDTSRVPGGSSGGSAAAVAACEVPLTLGTDTGGSIRGPAGFCGVVGLRPTYGAVSRYGMVALASSLDQIGPYGRTVADTALLFGCIAGQDAAHDATSRSAPAGESVRGIKGLRIGLPREYYGQGVSQAVRDAVLQAADTLRALGAVTVECSLPSTQYALPVYNVLVAAQAASNLGRYDGVRYGFRGEKSGTPAQLYQSSRSAGFGDEVKRRILLGTYLLADGGANGYYRRALCMQHRIADEFSAAFVGCDLLLTPVNATTAFRLGEKSADPVAMYAADTCTIPVSLAGLPALSVPCGQSEGLPIGLQLIGPQWSEHTLLGVAAGYEKAVGGFAIKEM